MVAEGPLSFPRGAARFSDAMHSTLAGQPSLRSASGHTFRHCKRCHVYLSL